MSSLASTNPSSSPTSGATPTNTFPPISFTGPPPTGTDGAAAATSSSADNNGTPSSSLYLFTFLATLFLLLAISSAIILRGIFLRRRFRRRLEEAFATGLLSPSDDVFGGGRLHRRKLQRPTLFDVSVTAPYFSTSSPPDGNWEKLMPFSGNISSEKQGLDLASDAATTASAPPRPGHTRRLLERAGYILPRGRLRRNAPPAPAQPASTPPTAATASPGPSPSPEGDVPLEGPPDPVARAAEVRVAVVIAMPHPQRAAYVAPAVDADLVAHSPRGKSKARGGLDGWTDDGHEEEGVPDVVFGVVRVPVRDEDAEGEKDKRP
ncbi:uncharacterized protein BXZ73DRAFT_104027 [Epithele typhae]|uniref:uncharacterized protein n=1 Tax=Epithele typhae TaxID=378194 RepID=UPI0020075ACD|nr:uncharacterized protein BXZ73DRAFT_104027 [Epithele typhae]KAH9922793.1 hypothetical protein BXZ73DRAFT_104027 [Epithele typhae]